MAMQFNDEPKLVEEIHVAVDKTVQDVEWDAEKSPELFSEEAKKMATDLGSGITEKTLHNSDVSGAQKNVPDIKIVGDGDTFKLICKASSEREGWMKSTKAMQAGRGGCVVQVTTQQRGIDGTYSCAEAVCYVPGVKLRKDGDSYLLVDI